MIAFVCGLALLQIAASLPGADVSILSAIIAVNFIITFLWLCGFWKEYKKVRLEIQIPGMLLCILGVVLLVLARKTMPGPIEDQPPQDQV